MPVWNPKTIQELVGSHYYIHAFWNKWKRGKRVKKWPPLKIREYHTHYVRLMAKRYRRKHPYKKYIHKSPLR